MDRKPFDISSVKGSSLVRDFFDILDAKGNDNGLLDAAELKSGDTNKSGFFGPMDVLHVLQQRHQNIKALDFSIYKEVRRALISKGIGCDVFPRSLCSLSKNHFKKPRAITPKADILRIFDTELSKVMLAKHNDGFIREGYRHNFLKEVEKVDHGLAILANRMLELIEVVDENEHPELDEFLNIIANLNDNYLIPNSLFLQAHFIYEEKNNKTGRFEYNLAEIEKIETEVASNGCKVSFFHLSDIVTDLEKRIGHNVPAIPDGALGESQRDSATYSGKATGSRGSRLGVKEIKNISGDLYGFINVNDDHPFRTLFRKDEKNLASLEKIISAISESVKQHELRHINDLVRRKKKTTNEGSAILLELAPKDWSFMFLVRVEMLLKWDSPAHATSFNTPNETTRSFQRNLIFLALELDDPERPGHKVIELKNNKDKISVTPNDTMKYAIKVYQALSRLSDKARVLLANKVHKRIY